ncbi:MAG: helix-turn-helix domain-containing protein [Cellvibrio sp.]|nr:helix-turn-helix domain-containing protein [Cellvibrio sp.]
MDMQINKELLRQEREQRGWTQSHLAEVADLSLRTVQRIEASGIASQESAMALASALERDLASFLIQKNIDDHLLEKIQPHSPRYPFAKLGILVAGIIALGWWSIASANPVKINLSVQAESGSSGDMQLSNEIGKQTEILFDKQFRVLVTTSREEKYLLLSAEIYDFVEGQYQLISSPKILVEDQKTASIHLDTQASGRLELGFTPDY